MDLHTDTERRKDNHLNRAKHNQEVCDYLKGGRDYHDWIVTTAFYSALHFANSWLLPIKYVDKKGDSHEFSSVSDYFNYLKHIRSRRLNKKGEKITIPGKVNKHNETRKLIRSKNKDASAIYKSLMNASMKARYNDYNVNRSFAEKACKDLESFKSIISV